MNNDVIEKLCKFAFVSSVLGVCTIGVCPAFAMMGIAVGLVFKIKGVKTEGLNKKRLIYSAILGAVALVFFVIDVILLSVFIK